VAEDIRTLRTAPAADAAPLGLSTLAFRNAAGRVLAPVGNSFWPSDLVPAGRPAPEPAHGRAV